MPFFVPFRQETIAFRTICLGLLGGVVYSSAALVLEVSFTSPHLNSSNIWGGGGGEGQWRLWYFKWLWFIPNRFNLFVHLQYIYNLNINGVLTFFVPNTVDKKLLLGTSEVSREVWNPSSIFVGVFSFNWIFSRFQFQRFYIF